MTKSKTLIIISAAALIGIGIFLAKPGRPKSENADIKLPEITSTIKENDEVPNENQVLTVSSLLEKVRPIVEWEGPEYSRGTILWNTKDEELKLEGRGYLFGDVMGSQELKDKHSALQVFLRDTGFEHDMYNARSSPPGSKRSILKLGNIGCELYIRDVERKASTDMGLLCLKLPEEVVNAIPEPMSEKRARSIAESGECVKDGVLTDKAVYNANSKTWWIDLETGKTECNPACVIYEDEIVEINWRCTGLNTE